ncbi:hypothetical protein FHR90_003457 [Endobacter medicaginis]|uniref:Uncharacterized protein n=1 Tax=Endobacter medicaginis TaxID=1181271 RepID=A0A850NQF1_9PROT|nr:hypothetical protein [Endobacter medicaginis]MBB3175595.1 hypothetical protein [Endobacter medicaginis]MCX5477271.1 hypothetical protein [Endobacter medicaginis]NVN31134.1 hypothetical protein [Endobacter medicaginis]
MDGNRIAALVSMGYAKSAAATGTAYQLYRPTGPSNPAAGTPLTSLPVTVSADSYRFRQPVSLGKPMRQVLVDTAQTRAGDYLVGAGGTLFIADQSPLLPVQAVLCNSVLTVKRAAAPDAGVVDADTSDNIVPSPPPHGCLRHSVSGRSPPQG